MKPRQTPPPQSETQPWMCAILCFPLVRGVGRKSYLQHMREKHPTLKANYKNVGVTGHQKAKNYRRYGIPSEEGE